MELKNANKWLLIVYGVLLIAVGVTTLILAITNIDVADSALSIAAAVALFIYGIINIAMSLIARTNRFFTTSLFMGSLAIAFGVVLCIDRLLLGSIIVYLVGILLLALALICLIKAILFLAYKYKVSWIVFHFIFAALGIAGGVLILCFRAESKMVLYAAIGSIIILSGLLEIIYTIRLVTKKDQDEIIDKTSEESDAEA